MQSFYVYHATESGQELLECFDDESLAIEYARDANAWVSNVDSVFVTTEWGDIIYIA